MNAIARSGIALALLAAARSAQAGEPEDLFEQGRALLDAGQYEEACQKLAQSFALSASVTTLGHLARCHEQEGKVATARAEYLRTAELARAAGDVDRARAAEALAQGLEGRIPRLKLTLREPRPGLELRCDGRLLDAAALADGLALDPGAHLIEASAPGHTPWSKSIELGAGALEVVVPPLEPIAPVAKEQPSSGDPRFVAGLVIGGAGVAGLAIGTVFGILALEDGAKVDELCGPPDGDVATCPPELKSEADELNDDAHRNAVGSTLGLAIGGAAVVGGAILVLTSATVAGEDEASARLRLVPVAGGGGLRLEGRF